MTALHPFFSVGSLYDLGTRESVWSDAGVHTMREFFMGLYRRRWADRYRSDNPPTEVPDLGFSPNVNALLHRSALERPPDVHGASPPLPGVPHLVILDMQDAATVAIGRPALVRCSELDNPNRSDASCFRLQVDFAPWGPAAYHAPVKVLVITHEMLEVLEGCRLDSAVWSPLQGTTVPGMEVGTRVRDQSEALLRILDPRVIEPSDEDGEGSLDRASKLCTLLSLAPGLAGSTDAAGQFLVAMDFGRPCPPMDAHTVIAVCVGPPRNG
ncbi:MAG: hypothetical protein Greene041619_762 [Candidatus Peregrinibacteria bacterium Greene0416_19]|nr:MAG: hypothetical protein Greene041619_762 [Candidatus Peregrinibacteria bacterium Greene0416_19]